jgi:hypothetical protein
LLESADRFFDQAEFSAAIVVAQTACEVILQRAVQRVFASRGVTSLGDNVLDMTGSFTLVDSTSRRFYKSVTGDDKISDRSSGFWPDYQAMVELRNKIVHQGIEAKSDQAKQCIEAAKKFVAHVAKVNGL